MEEPNDIVVEISCPQYIFVALIIINTILSCFSSTPVRVMASRRDNSIPDQRKHNDRLEERVVRVDANTLADVRLFNDPIEKEPEDRFIYEDADGEKYDSDGNPLADADFVDINWITGPTKQNRYNSKVSSCLEVQDKFLSRETGEFITGIFPSRFRDEAGQPSLCSCPFSTNVDMAAWRQQVGLSIEKACKYGKNVRLDQLRQHLQAKMGGCYRHEIAYNALIQQYPVLDQRKPQKRRARDSDKAPASRLNNDDRNIRPRNHR